VPAASVAVMVDAIVHDRKRIMPTVALLNNEYGESELAIGVPTVLGKNGAEKVIELQLNASEKKDFDNSVAMVRKDMQVLATL